MIWADYLPQLAFAGSWIGGIGFTGVKALLQRRGSKRAATRKKADKIRQRADRDHARTMKGDPRGMYGEYTPPREFVEIADDDQFIDQWDTCELCPKRGRAHALSDHGKKLGPGGFPPVAVWSGTPAAPVAPMRLCAICYRECVYGSAQRLNEKLPVPMPVTFKQDLEAWLEAEKTWQARLTLWLDAEKRWKISGSPTDHSNVTNFQAAAKRLGRENRLRNLAVGNPAPVAQLELEFLQQLQQAGLINPTQAWSIAARLAIQNQMFDPVGDPDPRLLDIATGGCDMCEAVYTHGESAPSRVTCSGLCIKRG